MAESAARKKSSPKKATTSAPDAPKSLQDRLRQIPLDDLTPDPKNTRVHSERNIDAIARSLEKYGQRRALVVQEKEGKLIVRAGNGTLEAARKLGWTTIEIAVFDEPDEVAAAFGIADNRTAEFATWDDDVLREVLSSLPADFEDALGFNEEELAAFRDATDLNLDLGSDSDDTDGAAEGKQFKESKGYEIIVNIADDETLAKVRTRFLDLAQKLNVRASVKRLGK